MLRGDSDLTYAVIGKAMEVHREIGPELQEPFYHQILSDKLNAAQLHHRFKAGGVLKHRGIRADEFEADLLFDNQLVVEVKVLERSFAPEHYAQILCYQKFWSVLVGLLMDFSKESLVYKRVVFDEHRPALSTPATLVEQAPEFVSDRSLLGRLWQNVQRIYGTHGLGYRDTTYRGLVVAELTASQVRHRLVPAVTICSEGKPFGQSRLNCIEVEEGCGVMVLALRREIRAADRAILQTYLRLLDLPWGIILNFGKERLEYRYVTSSDK